MESPRHAGAEWPAARLSSRLKPPARAINATATTHTMTASVSSQPRMSCHAGRVNRKKLSGRPKMGSVMLPVACGANQKRASVGHSCIIAVPERTAAASEPTMPTMRSTGSMERFTGCPPRMI